MDFGSHIFTRRALADYALCAFASASQSHLPPPGISGLTFASLLMTEQAAIFCGIMQWSGSTLDNVGAPLWVVDPMVEQINDLSQGAPRPFYELNTTADSGKAPGAGPMIVLGPAGAAARFVMAGKDLDRNVRQTASKIAAAVVQRTKQTP